MDLHLAGKTAAIVGGATGIGKAVCLTLAAEGVNIAVIDKNIEAAEATAKEIQAQSVKAVAVNVNLADFASVSAAFGQVTADLGQVEIMVFSDAVYGNYAAIKNLSVDQWNQEIAYTLSGAFYCAKLVGPTMKANKWGRLIFISNRAVTSGAYGQSAHIASMAGLLGLAKTAALEYGRAGVTSNIVFPGLVDTPAYQAYPEGIKDELVGKGLMRRLQEPEEIAHTVAYLCSDYAKGITGAEIDVTMGAELFVY
ncbi:MAG: SDR family oxidoreductase [Firmicutes bacterium]|nr:SDR family oxidoreductase [Bacillota bacterium]